jgi:hypothetical protein
MKRKYEHTGLYAFLEANGAETATAEQLTMLRKQYWRDCRRKWKAEKRKENYTVTLYFNVRELTALDRNVTKLRTSRPKYIKKLALKDISVPDTGQLRSLLYGNYEALLALCRKESVPPDIGAQLLCRMEALEQAVISQLQISFTDVR